ncbi:lysophospholipid acyltransferase family protein [Aureliella helgolandensis]|uniref:Lipid A biosynthesis lauroyl acyltransferase n=1 Tax=Aureliella helgolandensis TaxID=2527968 RepID=A0A518GCK0_9BACT|nr:lysophospholipid acyltransferase family protein [Aureliella helgolandensis]QDV26324.1 Lipid A biosynthesis lauroyl acyltransferase [Aureliella helgolandensis]
MEVHDSQPSLSRRWTDWLGYIAMRCVICLIQSISLKSSDRVCRLLAYALAHWLPVRREVVDTNLRIAFGELTDAQVALLRYKMWHHLLLMICEIAVAPRKIHRTNWYNHFYMPNKRQTLGVMLDARASVIVTGHFGNFEVAGHTVGILGLPPSAMARPLDNPYVDQYLAEFRSAGGQKILPKEGSSTAVQELLESRGTLAILADQYAGRKGCWVDFFGQPTSCHKALALFVLSAKAPMLVNSTRRLDRPLRFEMSTIGIADPELLNSPTPPDYLSSVQDLTSWYNARLEEMIRLAPEQYWWLHRRWRDVPPAVEKRLAAARLKQATPQAAPSPSSTA